MTAVSLEKLNALYATDDDPWNFRTSGYEQKKFEATRAALGRASYHAALEIGCGNGELARVLAPFCARYDGVDAVVTAITAARLAVPDARFHHRMWPGPLPEGDYDLIVLSEVLYFIDAQGIAALAETIEAQWLKAEILCVTYLGDTGNTLQGEVALELFQSNLVRRLSLMTSTEGYRIDRRMAVGDSA
ncbi:SAM-dependent methyltransferase [Roseobacter litoralis]|uniref:SAM-dependent methyltransferase n=1 Tax=Roseobacter litoralis TaxID=42443 RepID=UPI00249259CE|nr:SAM-dependent methyltransferase [Roseobacter litoralis]